MDMRNHGEAPRSSIMDYPALAADTLRAANLLRNRTSPALTSATTAFPAIPIPPSPAPPAPPPILLGHSMGGKAAMAASLVSPSDISALIVVDIAPVNYGTLRTVSNVADAMAKVPLSTAKTREEADAVLRSTVTDDTLRRFIMTNYIPARSPEGSASWKVNLDVIRSSMSVLAGFPLPPLLDNQTPRPFPGPALFLYGENSDYVQPQHHSTIKQLFPQAEIKGLPTGHWVHAEDPDAFVDTVSNFLRGLN